MVGLVIIVTAAILFIALKESAREKEERRRAEMACVKRTQESHAKALRAYEQQQRAVIAEQVRQAKEQERQAKELARHEEQLLRLDQRMAVAEREIAFNREQRDRLFELLELEELERDSAIKGSATWQKHQKKVIALENQIHTHQKRIDKAQLDMSFCEKKMSA